ncbi:hypothetical protein QFZ36_004218 [Pseudarthrobacter siccitolerans]|uniref:Uncharacterized protein n=1 Tax=Pseudarthrobacter siccitolerans TaxID=861266 RepID=A0ABU0PSQ3_9MICC|nr:hypothetical protein [Pseudarthrobacter siccitolerans]
MKEQKISGTGDQQGRAAPFRVWAPIVISALALVISTLGFMVQQSALDQQREQLAAQNGQLDTQKNQLDIQRNALETQQKEFQAAEDRWKAEGPLFVARGYLRQDPERSMALLEFSEDGPAQRSDEELENIYVSEGQAEIGPMFIEAEVTNVGRSPGQISSVWGELNGYRKDSRPLSPAPGLRICTATLGERIPTVCKEHFAEQDVICLGPDGVEAVCQFPLHVPQQTSIRLRFKLQDYFAEHLMCEGSLRGRVDVSIRPGSGPQLKSAFFASNWRGCPGGSGEFRYPGRVPFK